MGQAGPELQSWQDTYGARGLVPYGVSINETVDGARNYWQFERGVTHPWAADPMFSTGSFFDGGSVGTPAYVVIDLTTMEIVVTQQGYSGVEENLFGPYLR
jgi:hypothetical protein